MRCPFPTVSLCFGCPWIAVNEETKVVMVRSAELAWRTELPLLEQTIKQAANTKVRIKHLAMYSEGMGKV